MKRFGIVVAIAGLLLFSSTAWADEQTKNDGPSDEGNGTAQVQQTTSAQQEVKMPDMTTEEHGNMEMGGMDMGSDGDSHSESGTANEEGTSGAEHDSHGNEEVVEAPPNIPVLSTFGGIMLVFILYGAWNKWLRKKERIHA